MGFHNQVAIDSYEPAKVLIFLHDAELNVRDLVANIYRKSANVILVEGLGEGSLGLLRALAPVNQQCFRLARRVINFKSISVEDIMS